jgi:hypothetical protein
MCCDAAAAGSKPMFGRQRWTVRCTGHPRCRRRFRAGADLGAEQAGAARRVAPVVDGLRGSSSFSTRLSYTDALAYSTPAQILQWGSANLSTIIGLTACLLILYAASRRWLVRGSPRTVDTLVELILLCPDSSPAPYNCLSAGPVKAGRRPPAGPGLDRAEHWLTIGSGEAGHVRLPARLPGPARSRQGTSCSGLSAGASPGVVFGQAGRGPRTPW